MNRTRIILLIYGLLFFTCSNVISQVDNTVFRNVSSKNEGTIVNDHPKMDRHLSLNANWLFHLDEIPGFYVP